MKKQRENRTSLTADSKSDLSLPSDARNAYSALSQTPAIIFFHRCAVRYKHLTSPNESHPSNTTSSATSVYCLNKIATKMYGSCMGNVSKATVVACWHDSRQFDLRCGTAAVSLSSSIEHCCKCRSNPKRLLSIEGCQASDSSLSIESCCNWRRSLTHTSRRGREIPSNHDKWNSSSSPRAPSAFDKR